MTLKVNPSAPITEHPSMWTFRQQISVEHMTQALNNSTKELQVLRLFMQQNHMLQMLRYVPSIVKLLSFFYQKCHKKLDSSEAEATKVSDFLQQLNVPEFVKDECKHHLEHFILAWDKVRNELSSYGVRFAGRNVTTVPAEYCEQPVTSDCRLSLFLPSTTGRGICCLALLLYLADMQNNFLEQYYVIRPEMRPTQVLEVSLFECIPAHLINCNPDKDLLSLVLANCTYSLEPGKGSSIEYEFHSLGKQIEDRFLKGKPFLLKQLQLFKFKKDYTTAAVFKQIAKKIPQEEITKWDQEEIEKDFRRLDVVSDTISKIDIILGFLNTIGGDKNCNLMHFANNILKMDFVIANAKVQQGSCLKHVKSLWLLLARQKAKLLTHYGHDAFDQILPKYKQKLPRGAHQELEGYLRLVNTDTKSTLLSVLFEFIVLHIGDQANLNDEEILMEPNHALIDHLPAYMEQQGYDEIASLEDNFPIDVELQHVVSAWELMHRH